MPLSTRVPSTAPNQYSIDEAKEIAFTAIERLYPKGANDFTKKWIEHKMYREIMRVLMHPLFDISVPKYDPPMWLKPILNTIPEFYQDSYRKDYFGCTWRCLHCHMFLATRQSLGTH